MRTAAALEGMITDPVYEGKSMAAMIDLVRRGEIGRDSTVLYAHLGGQPALNAYASDRKSTRLNSSHANISYAVFCLKKKKSNLISVTFPSRDHQGIPSPSAAVSHHSPLSYSLSPLLIIFILSRLAIRCLAITFLARP